MDAALLSIEQFFGVSFAAMDSKTVVCLETVSDFVKVEFYVDLEVFTGTLILRTVQPTERLVCMSVVQIQSVVADSVGFTFCGRSGLEWDQLRIIKRNGCFEVFTGHKTQY